jgi:hypothetical protein
VLLRNGYACVHAEAERFIASFYSAIMNPLPQGSGFFSFQRKPTLQMQMNRLFEGEENEHGPAL